MKFKTKLVATICMTSCQQWEEQDKLRLQQADIIEWRLDYLMEATLEDIQHIVTLCHHQLNCPVLLTLRTEGRHPIAQYKENLRYLAKIADLLDVEWETIQHDCQFITELNQWTEIILSYHQFAGAWPNIQNKLNEMSQTLCEHLKLALNHSEDEDIDILLRYLPYYIESIPQTLSLMVMGEEGKVTRQQAPTLNEGFVYASIDERPKYGQLTLEEMMPYMKGKINDGQKEENSQDERDS